MIEFSIKQINIWLTGILGNDLEVPNLHFYSIVNSKYLIIGKFNNKLIKYLLFLLITNYILLNYICRKKLSLLKNNNYW